MAEGREASNMTGSNGSLEKRQLKVSLLTDHILESGSLSCREDYPSVYEKHDGFHVRRTGRLATRTYKRAKSGQRPNVTQAYTQRMTGPLTQLKARAQART